MEGKSPGRRYGRRCLLPAAVLAAAGALLSCPNPIDRALLSVVEDEIAPNITILQPQANSYYKTRIIVSGVLEDSSAKEGDHLGSPGSLEVRVLNSPSLNRTITFAADGAYSVSPADGTFAYGPAAGLPEGSFGLEISAVGLSGSQLITFVLTDRNGNESMLTISLFDDPTGPSIELSNPQNYSTYGLIVDLAGTVTNAEGDPFTTNVKSIGWRVPVAGLEKTLDLQPGSTHDIGGGKFENGDFKFDANDGSFSDNFSTFGQLGTLGLVVWAEDYGGDESEVDVTLLDGAIAPQVKNLVYPSNYSSAATASIRVEGTVTEPSDLANFAYTVTDGSPPIASANITGVNVFTGQFSFTFAVASNNLSGNLTVTILAEDSGGRDSQSSFTIYDDRDPPVIINSSLSADNRKLEIAFDDFLYSTGGGSGALLAADLSVDFQANGSGVSLAGYTVSRTDGSFLQGGEQSIRINLSYNGTPGGLETVQVRPASASVFDDVGNPALTTTTTGLKPLNDLLAANVQFVSSPAANGPYKAGAALDLTVRFSEAVFVTGTPTLALETGATDQQAVYQTGHGTSTLSFRYTVQTGDNSADLNYAAVNSLAGTIRDNAGNPANLTLPALASADSLAGRKALVIDTTPPAAPTVLIADGDGAINIGENAAEVSITISGEAGASYLITPTNATVNGGNGGILTGGTDIRTFTAGGDGLVLLSVALTDAAGNYGPSGGDSSTADLTPPNPPAVAIADGADGYISPAENAGVGLTITGTAGCSYTVTPVNATVSGGNAGTLPMGSDTRSFTAAANGPVSLTVSLTDPAGNTGASGADGSFAYIAPPAAPLITILDENGSINIAENAAGVDFTIEGLAGCSYTITPGNASVTGLLTGTLVAGSVTRELSAMASGAVSVSVVLLDPMGAVSAPGSGSSNADLSAPVAPSVGIQDGDGRINKAENDSGIFVQISGEADAFYTISLGNATFVSGGSTGILSGGAVTRSIKASASGQVTVSVTLRDAVGNTGGAGSDSSTADLSVPGAPGVTIRDGSDSIIDATENSNGVNLEITGEDGATYNLTLTNCTVEEGTGGTIPSGGKQTLTLRAAADGPVEVQATVTDLAGNQSPAGSAASTADLSG